MTIVNQSKAEGSKANLSDSSVVENLRSNILQMDAFTNVSFEQEVSALEESAVETMMISLLKSSSDLHF